MTRCNMLRHVADMAEWTPEVNQSCAHRFYGPNV